MNKGRVLNVVDAIDARYFDMESYATRPVTGDCGSTMCLAGWAATIAGDPPAYDDRVLIDEDDVGYVATELTASGRYIHDVAAEYLELTDTEAIALFHAYHVTTPDGLRHLVNTLNTESEFIITPEDALSA